MTAGPADPEPPPPARLPWVRWAVLTLVLLAELGLLSAGYDAADRGGDPGWAGTAVAWTPAVFRWALVAAAVTAILGLWFLPPAVSRALRTPYPPAGLILAVLGQLAAYGLFALATAWVMGEAAIGPGELAVWLAAGALTALTWALAAVPPRAWPTVAWGGRRLWLPATAVALVASLVARAAREEWDLLSGPTMRAAHALVRATLSDVVYRPADRLLGTSRFSVEVGVPCSGYEGIGLMVVYLAVYLTLFRHGLRFPRAFLLVPLALIAVWVANVIRLVALIWIGDRVSPSLALGGFHSQAGWVGFNAVALGLLILAHRSHLFGHRLPGEPTGSGATAAYLAPLLAAVVVQMLGEALSPEPTALYPVRVLVVAGLLLAFRRRYDVLRVPGRGSAFTGLLWGLTAGVGVFALWVALVPTESTAAPDDWPPWARGSWLAARVVGFVLVTPLAEELAFRGYLMRRLIASDFERVPPGRFTWASFVVSSVLFGLMHGEWLAGVLAGAAYGLVVVRTGRVRDAVVAHAVTNGLLMALEARLVS